MLNPRPGVGSIACGRLLLVLACGKFKDKQTSGETADAIAAGDTQQVLSSTVDNLVYNKQTAWFVL